MTNFCNKIPLYFQDVEVQVAPWNTTKAYMLAMKVSLTKIYIKKPSNGQMSVRMWNFKDGGS